MVSRVEPLIKAIIFDLGNVLIDFDHKIAASKISKLTGKTPQEIFDLFFDSGLTRLFEEGKISPPDFFSKVKNMLSLNLGFEEFAAIWNDIFFLTKDNLAVYDLALNLKKRYKITVLSNINILHLEYIRKRFHVFDAFHKVITSCELGVRKPDIQIYEKALEILGEAPAGTFYTDDRPELIKSAISLGIKGFVFQGAKRLKKDLLISGVNIN